MSISQINNSSYWYKFVTNKTNEVDSETSKDNSTVSASDLSQLLTTLQQDGISFSNDDGDTLSLQATSTGNDLTLSTYENYGPPPMQGMTPPPGGKEMQNLVDKISTGTATDDDITAFTTKVKEHFDNMRPPMGRNHAVNESTTNNDTSKITQQLINSLIQMYSNEDDSTQTLYQQV